MKLTLDDAVLSRLSHWTTADVVLDYDQTIGETGRPVDGCAIGTRFRLIAIDKGTLPPQFDVVIDSNLAPIYFKKDGELFLTKDMTLTQNADFRVQLKDAGSLIDSNVQVLHLRGKVVH